MLCFPPHSSEPFFVCDMVLLTLFWGLQAPTHRHTLPCSWPQLISAGGLPVSSRPQCRGACDLFPSRWPGASRPGNPRGRARLAFQCRPRMPCCLPAYPALCLHFSVRHWASLFCFFISHVTSCSIPASEMSLVTLYGTNSKSSCIWN